VVGPQARLDAARLSRQRERRAFAFALQRYNIPHHLSLPRALVCVVVLCACGASARPRLISQRDGSLDVSQAVGFHLQRGVGIRSVSAPRAQQSKRDTTLRPLTPSRGGPGTAQPNSAQSSRALASQVRRENEHKVK
jgi:hypothetical protein